MEQIGEAMDGMLNLQPKQSECGLTLPQRELARDVVERYGHFDNVLELFAPKFQGKYVINEHRCYFGTAPMLLQLKYAYGNSAPIEWLTYQILDLNRYSNCKMMTDYQVKSLAYTIYKDYYYLKLTEVMMFFSKVKAADYGQLFFGAVDPIPLMGALKRFAEDRAEMVRKKEEADARAEREKPRIGTINFEQFKQSDFYKRFIEKEKEEEEEE